LRHLLERKNIKELDAVLEYHVISGAAVHKADLKSDQKVKTLEGQGVDVRKTASGEVFVNAAQVVTADVDASNGVVHIIDRVLEVPVKNIVELAAATSDLSTLVTALKAGNLVAALSGKGPFTVFAPTNEAFAKLPTSTLRHLLERKNIKELDAVLEYHVISGAAVHKADLKSDQNVKTLEGEDVHVRKTALGEVFVNQAQVTTADVDASNGVVHIIDSVLAVPLKNIVELAVANPDMSTLVTALKAADLVGTLSGKGAFTVFGPSNKAFANLPAGVLDNLLKPENKAKLVDLLTYHVVLGVKTFTTPIYRKEEFPTVEGKNLTFTWHVGDCPGGPRHYCFHVNEHRFVHGHLSASNGALYPIDDVLIVPVPTIVELAVTDPDLSTLVTALKAGNLVGALSGRGPFTVFAPTNEAFAKLPKSTLSHLLDPKNIKELDAVLEYHVISGAAVHKADLKSDQRVETLEGQDVDVKKTASGEVFVNDAHVITADVDASNGVVHIIDSVLAVPLKNIVELAVATSDLSTLVTALKAGNLVGALSGKGPFTVFAPTNEAFAKLPKSTLSHLLDPKNIKELDAVLEYHVISGAAVHKADLKSDQKVKSLEGQDVDVKKTASGEVFVNQAQVVTADVDASNGVVHIIDRVLIPPTTSAATFLV